MQLSFKNALTQMGFNGKLLGLIEPFESVPGGATARFDWSRSLSNMAALLDNMKDCGFDGVIFDTYGPFVSPAFWQKTALCQFDCLQRQMSFALMLNPWIASANGKKTTDPGYVGPDASTLVIQALQSSQMQAIINAPNYIPEKGILDFSTGADPSKVTAALPGIQYWMRKQHFSWCEIQNGQDPIANLAVDNASAAMKVCGIYAHFFDGGLPGAGPGGAPDWNQQTWTASPTRFLPHQQGNVILDTISLINPRAPYAMYITINDGREGTDHISAFMCMLTGRRVGA